MKSEKNWIKKNVANLITLFRIVLGIILFFLVPFTPIFYTVYVLTGISDVLDGYLARKLKIESEFGSRLDSVADILMFTVMIFKMFPLLKALLSAPIIMCVALIFVVRILGLLIKNGKIRNSLPPHTTLREKTGNSATILPAHTVLNKATGILLFCLPFLINSSDIDIYLAITCAVASAAAIHELYLNIAKYDFKH